jgi:hypothetical protein
MQFGGPAAQPAVEQRHLSSHKRRADTPTIVAGSHRFDKKSPVDGCAPHLDESTLVGP